MRQPVLAAALLNIFAGARARLDFYPTLAFLMLTHNTLPENPARNSEGLEGSPVAMSTSCAPKHG